MFFFFLKRNHLVWIGYWIGKELNQTCSPPEDHISWILPVPPLRRFAWNWNSSLLVPLSLLFIFFFYLCCLVFIFCAFFFSTSSLHPGRLNWTETRHWGHFKKEILLFSNVVIASISRVTSSLLKRFITIDYIFPCKKTKTNKLELNLVW